MASHNSSIVQSVLATSLPHDVANLKHTSEGMETIDLTAQSDDSQYAQPTQEELASLRKVADSIPMVSYALCAVEFAERASYYGVTTVFSNFMQFPLPKDGNGAGAPPKGTEETAGALGRGLQFSNAFSLLFTFLAYLIPLFGAWIADTRLGRYKTIALGVLICGVAHILLIFGAIPSVLQAGHALAPFLIGYFILAFGAGIFKPNIAPTIIDQYQHQRPYTKILNNGEKVVVDPETTIQRVMLIFYALINAGAFFAVGTDYAEKYVGYWLAFLLPGIMYFLLPILLLVFYKRTVKVEPKKDAYNNFFSIIWIALKRNIWGASRKGLKKNTWKVGGLKFWDGARPSVLRENGVTPWNGKAINWTDDDVTDIQRTFSACGIFLYFIIYNLNDGGIGSLLSSQGSTLTTAGAPNDLLGNFNPLVIIITVPLLSHVIYPLLNRHNIKFGRITRIAFGFTLTWVSGLIGALIQWRIYETSPCGYYATGCTKGTGVSPFSIWVQIPTVALGAISECFCNVTAYELAYARSPRNMRGLVMSLFLLTNAVSSMVGIVVTPAIKDPYLVWIWAAPAVVMACLTAQFWWSYRGVNDDEYMTARDVLSIERLEAPPARGEIKETKV